MIHQYCDDCKHLQSVNYGSGFYCNKYGTLLLHLVDDVAGMTYKTLICLECAIEKKQKDKEKNVRVETIQRYS